MDRFVGATEAAFGCNSGATKKGLEHRTVICPGFVGLARVAVDRTGAALEGNLVACLSLSFRIERWIPTLSSLPFF